MFSMTRFLEPKLAGSKSLRAAHLRRAVALQTIITSRFGREFDHPASWKMKHIRAVLDAKAAKSTATAYDYYRAARVVLAALGRWGGKAENSLAGPWQKKSSPKEGGRPALLPGGAARNAGK